MTQVLVEDPDLSHLLDGPRLAAAIRDCVAQTLHLASGHWDPGEEWAPSDIPLRMEGGVGLLVLEGVLLRRLTVAGRSSAELLGSGDLLRPWQLEDKGRTLPRTARWRTLTPCRLAVLDDDFAARLGRYPEVAACLFSRPIRRNVHLAVQMAIVHQPRIDVRLHMFFWEIADRWGTVRSDGVHVPISLTHAMLAELVAARRPTVTKALGELGDRGTVVWTGSDWLLSGEPPGELRSLGPVRAA